MLSACDARLDFLVPLVGIDLMDAASDVSINGAKVNRVSLEKTPRLGSHWK